MFEFLWFSVAPLHRYTIVPFLHTSSKTTDIYTLVSRKSLANIKSPLDRIYDGNRLDDSNLKQ